MSAFKGVLRLAAMPPFTQQMRPARLTPVRSSQGLMRLRMSVECSSSCLNAVRCAGPAPPARGSPSVAAGALDP